MEKLHDFFCGVGFSGEILTQILDCFSVKEFAKNDYFCEEGKTSRYLGFIESGAFQYFTLFDGEELTTYISTENTFVGSLLSYINECPAREYIRAITDAKLWVIHKTDMNRLLATIPAFANFYIKLLEGQVCCIDNSRLNYITLNAEQRYEKMMEENPELLLHIPLQYLASMLGVTPRHLSRIRKNVR
jgi:CRP-like cAMP-binding protein